jgi:hypothetical protein
MGSHKQVEIAQTLKLILENFGLETNIQKFHAKVPNYHSPKFGGNASILEPNTQYIEGQNIFATRPGKAPCSLLLLGHYDTKRFENFRFVGANDGGSSTVLLLELARILKYSRFEQSHLGACSVTFGFLDGEEAFLTHWNEGEHKIQLQDHLYGSRIFVDAYLKKHKNYLYYNHLPITLTMVIDMIGHKNQELFITKGSHKKYSKILIDSVKNIKIKEVSFMIEDDHLPFLKYQTPVLHIIDWTNTKEWHTDADTAKIISYDALVNFGNSLINFLFKKRI